MDRDRFLARVAAEVKAGEAAGPVPKPECVAGPWNGPTQRDEMIALFVARLAELGASVSGADTRAAAQLEVLRMLEDTSKSSIACAPGLRWEAPADTWTDDVARADFGLSEADWGIANTGTVVLRHTGERGRSYSLVPPAVGFLLPVSRLMPSLGTVLALVHDEHAVPPACITFITGLSHSGDIAGVTCSGVHGPGEVHVWLIADE